jgi:hypothetical protein
MQLAQKCPKHELVEMAEQKSTLAQDLIDNLLVHYFLCIWLTPIVNPV